MKTLNQVFVLLGLLASVLLALPTPMERVPCKVDVVIVGKRR